MLICERKQIRSLHSASPGLFCVNLTLYLSRGYHTFSYSLWGNGKRISCHKLHFQHFHYLMVLNQPNLKYKPHERESLFGNKDFFWITTRGQQMSVISSLSNQTVIELGLQHSLFVCFTCTCASHVLAHCSQDQHHFSPCHFLNVILP